MSDLISRKKVIDILEKEKRLKCGYDADIAIFSIEKGIRELTTAYSVDGVVEELEENASRYTKKYVTPYGNNGYRDVKAISIHKAIEIVKNGGVDDDVCEWRYNDSEYYFESSCEHLHIFMSDGPKENKYEFCPYCGKKIKEMESD